MFRISWFAKSGRARYRWAGDSIPYRQIRAANRLGTDPLLPEFLLDRSGSGSMVQRGVGQMASEGQTRVVGGPAGPNVLSAPQDLRNKARGWTWTVFVRPLRVSSVCLTTRPW